MHALAFRFFRGVKARGDTFNLARSVECGFSAESFIIVSVGVAIREDGGAVGQVGCTVLPSNSVPRHACARAEMKRCPHVFCGNEASSSSHQTP